MGSLSVQGLSLSAGCPSGVVVGVLTGFEGTADYTLVNSGDSDAIVDAVAELVDDRGNSERDIQQNLAIGPNGFQKISHVIPLNARYDDPGLVTVTIRLTISGAVSLSDSTFCTFIVNP